MLPFGGLWYGEPNAISSAVGYAQFYSRSHNAVIRVYDDVGRLRNFLFEMPDQRSDKFISLHAVRAAENRQLGFSSKACATAFIEFNRAKDVHRGLRHYQAVAG